MLWVTVDGSGATKVLACSLLLDETKESIAWSCQCFADCFRVPPHVLFSDSAPAIKAAVAEVFPEPRTHHLLCIWHLSKNMLTALQPAAGPALSDRVRTAWWRLAKQSDKNSNWDSDWAALLALVEQGSGRDTDKAAAREWLAAREVDRERWAYRFTWRHRTLGIHSTQRIEAVHSAVSHFLSTNRLLTDLLEQLDRYTGNVELRTTARDLSWHARLIQRGQAALEHPDIIEASNFGLSAFALVLLRAQVQQAPFYGVRDPDPTDVGGAFAVSRRTGAAEAGPSTADEHADYDADHGLSTPGLSGVRLVHIPSAAEEGVATCSCQYPECHGLPCRHLLRVFAHLQKDLPTSGIDQRWIVRSEEQQRAAVLALLARRPPARDGAAVPVQPTRDDRFGLIMGVAKGLAETGSMSASTFEVVMAGLAALHDKARGAVTAPRGAAPTRGQAQAAAAVAEAAPQSRVCQACWQPGHNRRNRLCPQHGLPSLPRPEGRGAAGAVRVVSRGRRRDDDEEGEEEDEGEEEGSEGPADSGRNDNVCHNCSEPGDLLCCEGDGCHRSWHPRCAQGTAALIDDDGSWFCPVCTGTWASAPVGFIGNPPQARPGRGGGQQQKRKKPRTEETPAMRKKAKAAGRGKEVARKGGMRVS
jgi:hypothetical protein